MRTFRTPTAWWLMVVALTLAVLAGALPAAVTAQSKPSATPATKIDLRMAGASYALCQGQHPAVTEKGPYVTYKLD